MKIMQIMPNFGLAGAEIMCENLMIELHKRQEDVFVVSLYDYKSPITERLEKAGIRIIYLGKKRGLDITMIPKLVKVMKKERPDVIHTHRYVMQYAIPAAILAGVKNRVHTLHNIATKETTPKAQKLNNLFYHYACVLPVALSEDVRVTVTQRYKIPPDKIPVVYNGIDLERCIPKISYTTENGMQLLHIGRFSEAKNHAMMIRAFASVVEVHPDAHLTLVGTGELEEDMKKLTSELGLNDQITFYGTTGDVYPLLHNADVFLLPSVFEGMPMTLIEAMGTGLPIVSTRVGGICDMLTTEQDAILVEPDQEKIAHAILRLWDEELRSRLGKAARARALKTFSSSVMADKYLRLYKR